MPQKVLMISHSVGDTQIILASAKAFAKKGIATKLLAVGKAALAQMLQAELNEAQKKFIEIVNLDTLLPTEQPIAQNVLSFNPNQIEKLTAILDYSEFSGMLVGTPSYTDAALQSRIPIELLTAFAPHLATAVISDYAFYDPEHNLSKERWFTRATKFFVPFKKAIQAFQAEPEKTIVVGHPSIDALKAKFAVWSQTPEDALLKKREITKKLEVNDSEKLIFVAGGKAGDEAMIKALSKICQKYPNVQIRMGVHPGASNEYWESLQEITLKMNIAKQIRILPPKSISSDECVFAADAVLSVSSTMTTAAGECEKLSGFYQEGKKETDPSVPYAVGDNAFINLYTSEEALIPFFETMCAKKPSELSKTSQVVATSDERIVEAMQQIMPRLA